MLRVGIMPGRKRILCTRSVLSAELFRDGGIAGHAKTEARSRRRGNAVVRHAHQLARVERQVCHYHGRDARTRPPGEPRRDSPNCTDVSSIANCNQSPEPGSYFWATLCNFCSLQDLPIEELRQQQAAHNEATKMMSHALKVRTVGAASRLSKFPIVLSKVDPLSVAGFVWVHMALSAPLRQLIGPIRCSIWTRTTPMTQTAGSVWRSLSSYCRRVSQG